MNTTLPIQGAEPLALAMMPSPRETHERAMKIMAKSIVRSLQSQGYEVSILLSLITELIEVVTVEMQRAAGRLPQPNGSPRAAHLDER